MRIKDINYLKENGLSDDRVKLLPFMDLKQAERVAPIAFNELDLMQYSPTPIHTPQLLETYFQRALQLSDNNEAVVFLIYDRLKESYAGSTRFAHISSKDQRVEIGWTWLGRSYRRTGLNRHNKYLMLSYAFEKANCERVEFKADARNKASRTAMEGIGATYEGLLRSHTLMSDGYRRDTVYYSILRSEWPGIKEQIFPGM